MTGYSFVNLVSFCLGTEHSPRRSPEFKKPFVKSRSGFGRSISLAVVALGILMVLSVPKVSFAQVEFDISTPKTSTVGAPATIDAEFYYDGKPVTDVWMIFEVIEGPNKGVQGKVKTDKKGRASFTYTSKKPGEDIVEYGWKCPETGKRWRHDTVRVTWVRKPEEPTEPEIPVEGVQPGNTEEQGPKPGTTLETAEPIFAGGGEFRQSWTLLSLGGPIPLDFTLIYAPDLESKCPANDGRTQFPPWNSIKSFTSNTIMRVVEFEDRTVSPHQAHINVFLSDDGVVFKDDGKGYFVASGSVKYQLTKTEDHYYMLDPIRELVYIFRSRQLGWDLKEAGQVIQHIRRAGEVVCVLDRNGNRLSYAYNHDNLPTRIEDGLGRVLELTYTRSSNIEERHLTTVSDGYGRTVTFSYQEATCREGRQERLVSFSDATGNITIFEYFQPSQNECNLLQKVIRPLGNSHISQTWAKNPHGVYAVNSQKDAYGNETKLTWTKDTENNLITTVSHPDGANRVFHHERERYPLDVTDETGKQFSIGYNGDWQMTSVTDRLGDTTSLTYHSETGHIASITNNRGETVAYTYTPQNQSFTNPINGETVEFTFYNLTRTDYPDGSSEHHAYDAQGNLTQWTNQAGEVWRYKYNDRGLIIAATNPAGGVTEYTYNADATLASSTDTDMGVITYVYDRHKRPAKIAYPDGSTLQFAYDVLDRITALTDKNGKITAFGYDANGNLVLATDPNGASIRYAYDLMDRVVQVTDRTKGTTRYAYDEIGRLVELTDPTGVVTKTSYEPRGWMSEFSVGAHTWGYEYDDEGLLAASITPAGHRVTLERDPLGYLVGTTNSLNQTYSYDRDALSRITDITNPLGNTTSYSYDPHGLLSTVALPGGDTATYTWSALGLPTQMTDPNGESWTFDYSSTGRLLSASDPLGNTWGYNHDCCGRLEEVSYPDDATLTCTYNPVGNLLSLSYSDGTELQYGYDELDRLTSADGIALTRNAEGRVINTENSDADFGATYDAAGRLETVTYADGAFTVTYSYSPDTGLLTSVSDDLTGTKVEFIYDDDLQLAGLVRSNGVEGRFTWDGAGRLTHIREGSLADLQYTYNAAGELIQEVRILPLGGGTISYEYDGAGRLTAADYGNGNRLDYGYDAAGNLLERIGRASLEGTGRRDEFTYDQASQVSTAGHAYDPRGRLVTAPEHTYTWNVASRLVGLDDVELGYNGFGELINRSERGQTTRYCYNYAIGLAPIVAEKNVTTGQFLRYYVWTPSGQLLYTVDAAGNNGVYFYHFDRVGSILALTDTSGAVTDAYAYAPYGKLLRHDGISNQPFTFLGRWGVRQETESGSLYHIRARYYDVITARFTSRDPVWPRIGDPRQINPYQYALSEPINHMDRTGLVPCGFLTASSSEISQRISDLEAQHSSLLEAYCQAKGEERAIGAGFESFYNETADDREHLHGLRKAEDKLGQLGEIMSLMKKIGDIPVNAITKVLEEGLTKSTAWALGEEIISPGGPGTVLLEPFEVLANHLAAENKAEADLLERRLNLQEEELSDKSVANYLARLRYSREMNRIEREIEQLKACRRLRWRVQAFLRQCFPLPQPGGLITTPSVAGKREAISKLNIR